jgi:hypothetical protein
VVRRRNFHEVQGWTDDVFPLEDLELLIKLSGCNAIQIMSPPAISYRIHAGNSIHSVAPFVRELRRMIGKVKRAQYPGSRSHRLESYAFMGGPALYWVKRAYRRGVYASALRLLASGWTMIAAAMICRARILVQGRRMIETIPLERSGHV